MCIWYMTLATLFLLASSDTSTCKSKQLAQHMLDSVDLSVDPCEDFYQYSCTRWEEQNPIPDEQSRWLSFRKLDAAVKIQMKDVLSEQLNEGDSEEKNWAKTYFISCLNPTDSFAQGFGVKDLVKMVSDWPLMDENATKHLKAHGANRITMYDEEALRTFQKSAFFPFGSAVNDSDNSRNIINFYETTLTLATAKYLDKKYEKYQGFLKTFIKKSATLLARDGGFVVPNDQDKQIEQLFQFEKEIAEIYPTKVARLHVSKRRNIKTIDQLHQLIDGDQRNRSQKLFIYAKYNKIWPILVANNVSKNYKVNVANETFYKLLAGMLRKTLNSTEGKRTIKNFVIWRGIISKIKYLGNDYYDLDEEYKKNSTGKEATTPYWKYCLKQTTTYFSEGVSAVYVDRFVPIGTKSEIEQISDDMKMIYLNRMDELDWMDNETREYAKFKLKKIKYHYIINPKLNMSREGVAYKQVLFDEQIQSLFKMNMELHRVINQNNGMTLFRNVEPADNLVFLPATAVNAFYYAKFNTIIIPGAILQAPFYDINGSKEVNMAGIGSVIAHEMSHAFDTRGSKYGANGSFYNWWSNESVTAFKKRTECLISQYSAYEVPEINKTLNGNLTVGENIADNAGVRVGYQAATKFFSENGKRPAPLLSRQQTFFLGFAMLWCEHTRKQKRVVNWLRDTHSPGMLRVNGVVSNMKEFADAFGCKPGSTMNPEKKCILW